MKSGRSTLLATALGLLAPLLISCHSAPTRIHTLHAVAPASSITHYAGPPIRIDAVHVPPALDRIEVITGVAEGELRINDLDYWAAPLSQLAVQVLSADMVARLPPDRVIFPELRKPEGALGISVDILDFGASSTSAFLEASWTIASPQGDIAPRRGTGTFKEPGTDVTAAGTAQALSALLAQLADQIVAELLHEPNAG
jgi:uncharacterized protein